jgi:hypothetical protein
MTATRLTPCSSCARHVRRSEAVCPFCGLTTPVPSARGQLSRAVGIALGVATLTNAAALGACLHAAYGAPSPPDSGSRDGGTDAAVDGGPTP